MLNAHYRTCNLTPKHECVISHTHSRTCILTRKRYDYPYLRAAIASLRTGERSGRCPLGLLLHTGATPMGNGCSLGLHLHTGVWATSLGLRPRARWRKAANFPFFAEMSTLDISAESAKKFVKVRGGSRGAAGTTVTHWGYVYGQRWLLVGVTVWGHVRGQGR